MHEPLKHWTLLFPPQLHRLCFFASQILGLGISTTQRTLSTWCGSSPIRSPGGLQGRSTHGPPAGHWVGAWGGTWGMRGAGGPGGDSGACSGGLGAGMGVWGVEGVWRGRRVRGWGARRGHRCRGTGADLVPSSCRAWVSVSMSPCAGRCPSMGPTCQRCAAGARKAASASPSCPEVGEDLASSGPAGSLLTTRR